MASLKMKLKEASLYGSTKNETKVNSIIWVHQK